MGTTWLSPTATNAASATRTRTNSCARIFMISSPKRCGSARYRRGARVPVVAAKRTGVERIPFHRELVVAHPWRPTKPILFRPTVLSAVVEIVAAPVDHQQKFLENMAMLTASPLWRDFLRHYIQPACRH